MNGAIGVESIFGESSFFYVEIPISNEIPVSVNIKKELDFTPPTQTDINAKKFLYIEDISANVSLMEQILDQYKPGIKLISAPNALDGIEIAQAQNPELILMDIHLPGMDGIEAFKKLRAMDKTKNIPIIALTADAMNEDVKKALDMGFSDYITKPIDAPKLLIAIDKFLA
jgi:CheY-like chemotaxis protein